MNCTYSLSIYPKELTLFTGDWYENSRVDICPDNCSCCCSDFVWHSDNEEVVSVNPVTGYLYAVSEGTAGIYVTSCDGTCTSDFMIVTVNKKIHVTRIYLSHDSVAVEIGETKSKRIIANIAPMSAYNKEIIWKSENESVATVRNGIITGISAGITTITATSADRKNISASCTVKVTTDVLVDSITLSINDISLGIGDSFDLQPQISPENAKNKTVTWHTDDPYIATVDPYGIITGTGVGTANIFATSNDGNNIRSSICKVTVHFVHVANIDIYPKEFTLAKDNTLQMTSRIEPRNAGDKRIIWSSSNTYVATVDDNGLVRAKNDGKVTISAKTVDGEFLAHSEITVDSRPVAHIIKDDYSFYIEFDNKNGNSENKKIWRYVGLNLTDPANRSKNLMYHYKPHFNLLKKEEQRYVLNVDNIVDDFTAKELALLYLFDPLGIEFYIRSMTSENRTLELLKFKDEIYKFIFGSQEYNDGKFYFKMVDNKPVYGKYDNTNRINVYSNAEVLFGSHIIYDLNNLMHEIYKNLFEFIESELDFLIWKRSDSNSVSTEGYDSAFSYQVLWFTNCVENGNVVVTKETIKNFAIDATKDAIKDYMGWVGPIVILAVDSIVDAFKNLELNNLDNIEIYNKAVSQGFRIMFENNNLTISMEDFIKKVNESKN